MRLFINTRDDDILRKGTDPPIDGIELLTLAHGTEPEPGSSRVGRNDEFRLTKKRYNSDCLCMLGSEALVSHAYYTEFYATHF